MGEQLPTNIDPGNTEDDHIENHVNEEENEVADIENEPVINEDSSEDALVHDNVESTPKSINKSKHNIRRTVPPPLYATRKKRKLNMSEIENEVRESRPKRSHKNEPEGFHCG